MDQLQSPFAIPHEDVEALNKSEGFSMLRTYLASNSEYVSTPPFQPSTGILPTRENELTTNSFCDHHNECDTQEQETWVLHRDILHALIMPVVALFQRASALAEAALCTHMSEDLELAFAGEARGAFLCLQCFLTEEEEWCQGLGCPGMRSKTESERNIVLIMYSMRCHNHNIDRVSHSSHDSGVSPVDRINRFAQ